MEYMSALNSFLILKSSDVMPSPKPLPGLSRIAPYVAGDSEIEGKENVVKLASNEGAFGPSPRTIAALQEAAQDYHRYPDGDSREVREIIAARHNVAFEQVICGCGSDELINLLCRSYAGPGDQILYSAHGFAMYPIYGLTVGADVVAAPETGITVNVDNMLAAVEERTRLVFLANPNNPTGTYLPEAELRRLHAGLRNDILLVVDCAYEEYIDEPDYVNALDMVREYKNVVVLRTFSKIYGMGGIRLGWGYFPPEVADIMNRMRSPFNVSYPAQVAGAVALHDTDFIKMSQAHNKKWLSWTTDQLRNLGLTVPDSYANFVIARFPPVGPFDSAENRDASAADSFLKSRGIIVRQLSAYGLPDALRISIGLEEEMRKVVKTLAAFLE